MYIIYKFVHGNIMSSSKLENPKKTRGRRKKDGEEDKLVLRIDLEKNLAEDFFKVKKSQGLTNNTEVIRFCIREIASSKIYRIPESINSIIEETVQDTRIQDKYIITDVDDFISRAIKQFILQTRLDKSNLHDWDYRSSLDPHKRDIANIIIKKQAEQSSLGVTVSDLHSELNYLAKEEIERALQFFENKKLISKMTSQNIIYYYAVDRGYITDEPINNM